jgi:GntR family transcriptional regulator
MYRQIAEDLRQKIESGDLTGGSPLPSQNELQDQYDASRNTIRDAVKWLITRGLVETRPGAGTFVVAKIDPYVTVLTGAADAPSGGGDIYLNGVTAVRRRATASDPRVEVQQAAEVVAEELQIAAGSTVISRHQQRYIDDMPFSLQISFYPMSLVEQGAVKLIQPPSIPQGAVAYLSEELGLDQVGYCDKLTVRAPDATEAAFFKLPDDGSVAVFEVRRAAFDQHGQPFRLTISVYPADRNQFIVSVGRVPDEMPERPLPGVDQPIR